MVLSRFRKFVGTCLMVAIIGPGALLLHAQEEVPPPPPPPDPVMPMEAPPAQVDVPEPNDQPPPDSSGGEAAAGRSKTVGHTGTNPTVTKNGAPSEKKGASAIPAGQELVNMDFYFSFSKFHIYIVLSNEPEAKS